MQTKTCKSVLYFTFVSCPAASWDVNCLRCVLERERERERDSNKCVKEIYFINVNLETSIKCIFNPT